MASEAEVTTLNSNSKMLRICSRQVQQHSIVLLCTRIARSSGTWYSELVIALCPFCGCTFVSHQQSKLMLFILRTFLCICTSMRQHSQTGSWYPHCTHLLPYCHIVYSHHSLQCNHYTNVRRAGIVIRAVHFSLFPLYIFCFFSLFPIHLIFDHHPTTLSYLCN